MAFKEGRRGVRVPLADRQHDLRMLGDQVGPHGVEGLQRDHAQPGLRGQRPEHPGQPLAARAADEDLVQVQVQADQQVPVVRRGRLQFGERGIQIPEVRSRAGQQPRRRRFDGAPREIQVSDVLLEQLRDEHAAGGVGLEQALLDQALEGLPHRAPAHTELARDLDLAQRLARRQPAADDPRAQLRGDPLRRRVPPQRLKHVPHACHLDTLSRGSSECQQSDNMCGS
jgi:hypothetical protein